MNIKKLKQNGLGWAFRAMHREWRMPNHPRTKKTVIAIKSLIKMPYDIMFGSKSDGVVGVYDLNINPSTYDFAYFICGLEAFSRSNGYDKFYLYFVKKDEETIQAHQEYSKVVSNDLIDWKFNNIVIPIVSMCPACSGYSIVNKSNEIDFNSVITYPHKYSNFIKTRFEYHKFFSLVKPENFSGLMSTKAAIGYVKKFLDLNGISENFYNKVVVISLRDYAFDVERNSNVKEWVKFAKKIKELGYYPIFIPDADRDSWNLSELDGFIIYSEASLNTQLRMAIYEIAYLNLFVNSGLVNLAMLNKKVSYIVFKLVNLASLGATPNFWKAAGIEIGSRNFSFSTKRQVLNWNPDNFEEIYSEFLQFQKLNDH